MTKKITCETIGCDLGDKSSEMCILGTDGGKKTARIRTTRKAMTAYFEERKSAHVVIEVGTHSRWVSQLIEGCGHRVTIANPRRLKMISADYTKTDRRDAEMLARLGRADEGLLSPVVHRDDEVQADLAVAKARDALVGMRTKLINHVRGVTKSFGDRLPSCTSEAFAKQTPEGVPMILAPALRPVYEVLEMLDEKIKHYDKTIDEVAKKYPEIDVVKQPKGVGTLTALVFVLTLWDKTRFAKSRTVGAYIGLRPRKGQSGEQDPQLRITKAGDSFLRRLLVTSANYILGPFGPETDLKKWGLAIAERGGKNAKKRAKVAVARKLSVLLHRMWMPGEVYEPCGYHERQLEQRRLEKAQAA
jgi:transposase